MPESDSSLHSQINVGINEFNGMISQPKEKFKNTDSRSEKLKILTVLPKILGICSIEKEFQTSNWLPRKAKELVRSEGILSSPNPQPSKARLAKCLEDIVNTFYESDEISCTMPGKKDGKRINVQKRLILDNMKEIFNKFKNDF
jgi:hypothetical protein